MPFLEYAEQGAAKYESNNQIVSIYQQLIGSSPFAIEDQDGQVNLSFQGRTLSYHYDMVVSGLPETLGNFNPGGSGDTAWFFALRDGLWYYVEVYLAE